MRTIAVINQKGGVGKTTTAHNLGAGLARLGRRVLMVDADPQAHLTAAMGQETPGPGLRELLLGELATGDAVRPGPGTDLIPGSLALAGLEPRLAVLPEREGLLRRALASLPGYDLTIIDCPPNLGLLTVLALGAAGEVLVPMPAEFLAMQGLAGLLETLRAARARFHPALALTGILLTRFDGRRRLGREVAARLAAHFPDLPFHTTIRENVALAEAPGFGQDIFAYAPASRGAADYAALCAEVAARAPRPIP